MAYNIVYITNLSWLRYTFISMYSLKINKKADVKYKVYVILVECGSDWLIRDLESDDFDIVPIFISNNCFQTIHHNGIVYFRLFLQYLIPVDYLLHIDSDTIILQDISDIFQYKPKYISAVSDGIYEYSYCNAGIMLLNLKNFRHIPNFIINIFKLKKTDKEIVKYNLQPHTDKWLHEQDMLNIYFRNRIDIIPYYYNFIACLYNHPKTFAHSKGKYSWLKKHGVKIDYTKIKVFHCAEMHSWKYGDLYCGQMFLWTMLWKLYEKASYNKTNIDINIQNDLLRDGVVMAGMIVYDFNSDTYV